MKDTLACHPSDQQREAHDQRWELVAMCEGRHTFMNSFMVVGGYFLPGPWISTSSQGHTNQPME
jgi:hypothetical protein